MLACWSANIVGAFFIALLAIEAYNGSYAELPYHAIIGILATCVFWLICSIVGPWISGAILIVPAIFLIIVLINTAVDYGSQCASESSCESDSDSSCSSCESDSNCSCDSSCDKTCNTSPGKKFVIRFKPKCTMV